MSDIHNLANLVPASGSKTRTGKFRLDSESELVLDTFVEWLKTAPESKSTNTANSYRSYVAKAQFLQQSWEDMTSDQRSAVRAFARFLG